MIHSIEEQKRQVRRKQEDSSDSSSSSSSVNEVARKPRKKGENLMLHKFVCSTSLSSAAPFWKGGRKIASHGLFSVSPYKRMPANG